MLLMKRAIPVAVKAPNTKSWLVTPDISEMATPAPARPKTARPILFIPSRKMQTLKLALLVAECPQNTVLQPATRAIILKAPAALNVIGSTLAAIRAKPWSTPAK